MTLLDDLQEKLSKAQSQVQKATAELSGFAEVKSSLQSADQQVKAAALKLDELSSSLIRGTAALEKAANSLAGTNDIIQKTDPAEVLKALASILSRQKSMELKLDDTAKKLGDETDSALNELRQNICSAVRDDVKSLEVKVNKAVEQGGRNTREFVASSTKLIPFIIGITVVNTVIILALANKVLM